MFLVSFVFLTSCAFFSCRAMSYCIGKSYECHAHVSSAHIVYNDLLLPAQFFSCSAPFVMEFLTKLGLYTKMSKFKVWFLVYTSCR
uniref:Putative secreted protein n=1 Tax=Rhipicephalus microplus TaxID=6941 RepID=A0A6M2DD21_RHIMP